MLGRSAISSHSLGRAWVHDLPRKLDAAQRHGHDIELFYEDVEYIAKSMPDGATPANLLAAANVVRSLCNERGLRIICLQPFMHYEGLRDRERHAERIQEMKLWIQLADILGTNLIGIPSSFLPEDQISDDLDLIVADLQEVADLGRPHGIIYSYEALCWGTYVNTWEQAWQIVQAVARSNFGICLDTFNMAGKMYADPEAVDGKVPDADRAVAASMERLRAIDVTKVFCVQVVDAEQLAEPMSPSHAFYNADQPARMSWSRNCRLFYGEYDRGAYLPVKQILATIIHDLGFKGPISAEVFNICLTDADTDLPFKLAERAAVSWRKIEVDMEARSRASVQARPDYAVMAPLKHDRSEHGWRLDSKNELMLVSAGQA